MAQDKAVSNALKDLKLTNQEKCILEFLSSRKEVALDDLRAFSKDPKNVKRKTLLKTLSDLKKKFATLNIPFEYRVKISEPKLLDIPVNPEPVLIQIRTTTGGNKVPISNTELDAHIDFRLDKMMRRVITRTNSVSLSENEWEIFVYLHEHAGKMVSIEDLKNLVYKGWGSKTPHYWSDSIKRTLTKLRTNIRELKSENRLVTVMGTMTHYMLK